MGLLPRSILGLLRDEVVALGLVLFEVLESNVCEEEPLEVPMVAPEDEGGRDFLYLDPGYPGRVGSSSLAGLFDSMTTTRRMLGRNWGSAWVHSKPICMHIAICSIGDDIVSVGSIISKLFPFLYSLHAYSNREN